MWSPYFRVGAAILELGVLLAALGCGGSSNGSTQFRVLQASPSESSVNVLIDSATVNTGLGYAANTGYISTHSGSRHVQVQAANSSSFIVDKTLSLASSGETTLIVTGLAPSISSLVLTDSTTAATSGTASIRFVNAAPSMGTADVYIVAAGSSLTAGSPTVAALAYGQASSYQTITLPTSATSGANYTVFFTQTGTTLALLDTGPFTLATGQNRTLVAVNNLNSGFSSVTLADLN